MSSTPTEATTPTKTRDAFRYAASDWAFWLGLLFMAILAWQVSNYRQDIRIDEHRQAVDRFRAQKDLFFRTGATSPLRNRASFDSLTYYPVDFNYRYKLRLLPVRQHATIWLSTTADTRQAFLPAGWVQIPVPNGGVKAVQLLQPIGSPGKLLLPFTDLTSGTDTPESGRYIDVQRLSDTFVLIDFNLAYLPYCQYNRSLACPEAPEENSLPFYVRAGERLAED